MVGAVDWSQRQFNNAVKARVQPGSTAKLPLLVAACEAGRKPESRVLDLPVTGHGLRTANWATGAGPR